MAAPASSLPRQGDLAAAAALLVWHAVRFVQASALVDWWAPVILLATLAAADFATGCVHWFADTWGSEDLPLIGTRLIRPFRIHHVNPDEFLDRSFIDANDDVALLNLPMLVGALFVPLDSAAGQLIALDHDLAGDVGAADEPSPAVRTPPLRLLQDVAEVPHPVSAQQFLDLRGRVAPLSRALA